MNIILLIILAFVLLIILKNLIEKKSGISDVLRKVNDKYFSDALSNLNKAKNHITNKLDTAKYTDPYYKFPDPMLSNISYPLSKGYDPLNRDNNNLINNNPDIPIIRNNGLDFYKNKEIYFDPFRVHEDTMDADPGKITIQAPTKKWSASETLIKASNDDYLTKYPGYASSNIVNELTNTGYLYDDDNKYINLKNKILPENCQLNGDSLECNFNNKLQKIPNQLMHKNSKVLDSIGNISYDDELIKSVKDYTVGEIDGYNYKIWNYDNEKEFNGGDIFTNKQGNKVIGSNPPGHNESYMLIDENFNCGQECVF